MMRPQIGFVVLGLGFSFFTILIWACSSTSLTDPGDGGVDGSRDGVVGDGSEAGPNGVDGGACAALAAQFTPCGGNIVGTWTLRTSCNFTETTLGADSGCPGSRGGVTQQNMYTGTETYDDAGVETLSALVVEQSIVTDVPLACGPCACAATNGFCECSATQEVDVPADEAPYAIDGNSIVYGGGGDPYCVSGNQLMIQSVVADGGTFITVLDRNH